MKNIFIFAVLFLGILLAFSIAIAAPAANQFVTNNQTNQCAIYWLGDEFTRYALPDNWTIVELNVTGLNDSEITDLMNTTCINMSYAYIGQLMNLTKTCISNCTTDTVLNDITCMCEPMLFNETNQTENQTTNETANKTGVTLPNINLGEKFSDPYVLGALGIIVIAIIVMFYLRTKKEREQAENFQFPPP